MKNNLENQDIKTDKPVPMSYEALKAERDALAKRAISIVEDAANQIAYAVFNLSDKSLDDLNPGLRDTTCPTDSALLAERHLRAFAAELREAK